MQDAFGVDREGISKKITPKGARSLWGATTAAADHGLRTVSAGRGAKALGARPQKSGSGAKRRMVPSASAAAAGDDAVSGARSAVRGRKITLRRRKVAAGTAGAAVASGGAVVGVDAWRKKKAF